MIIYYTIITIQDWTILKSRCINEKIKMSVPKLLLNIVIIIHSIYMLFQAYCRQKWDKELRIEYTAFIVTIVLCKYIKKI